MRGRPSKGASSTAACARRSSDVILKVRLQPVPTHLEEQCPDRKPSRSP
jgi:hypothetical protein